MLVVTHLQISYSFAFRLEDTYMFSLHCIPKTPMKVCSYYMPNRLYVYRSDYAKMQNTGNV